MNTVLAMKGEQLPEDNLVAQAAMDTGIGNPGLGHAMRRPFLLMYLVEFTRRFKREDHERRLELLSNAWDFKRWLVGADRDEDGEAMMRHILLHLLFPEEYERIASEDHKWRIRETFEGLVADPDQDVDRALFQIRERLHQLLPDGQPDMVVSVLALRVAFGDRR